MKIAQVAPLYESVPPKFYGGTERVVSYLTEELVGLGHDVTLFASGDSVTSAKLVKCSERSLRLDPKCKDRLAYHMMMLDKVFADPEEFDFFHFHIDYLHFALSRRMNIKRLSTLHGRLDLPDLVPVYKQFSDEPLVSISNSQRKPLSWANWLGTVYHGLPTELYPFHEKSQPYLAFLGRISPEKGLDQAIEIAKKSNMALRIAAKVDEVDVDYFIRSAQPIMNDPMIEFIGEIGEKDKAEFLGNATALLFPIVWPEPFGLVMIEAMSCGTPVIAYGNGSVPEIIRNGVNGYIVENQEQAVAAVQKITELDRRQCREDFIERFSVERMVSDYIELYEHILESDTRYAYAR
ncbi:glycosyltransferase family 4 protein [bacterium]|nr:glycosyltransferase family 4 protein [bacterium]